MIPFHFSTCFYFLVITCAEPLTYNECINCCPVSCQQSQCIDSKLPCIDGCYCPDGKFCFSNTSYLIPYNFHIVLPQVYIPIWPGWIKMFSGPLYKCSGTRVWMNDLVFLVTDKSLFFGLASGNRFQRRSTF